MTCLKCRQKINNMNISNEIIKKIKNGGIVIFPTDTVYGIGSIPLKNSLNKIYEIKHRDFSKKIIALISSNDILKNIVDESEENLLKIQKILKFYWPGELTIIFKANKNFTNKFDETMETIGVRIPQSKIALNLIEKVGGILLTSSANLSGEKSTIKLKEINKTICDQVDVIIEAREKLTGIPSTIIKYEEGKISLLREGNIKFENILKLIDEKN